MEQQTERPATPFIDELVRIAPEERAKAILAAMEGMSNDELLDLENDAKSYFARRNRDIQAAKERRMRNLARADLSPYGNAAARRRKQAAKLKGRSNATA